MIYRIELSEDELERLIGKFCPDSILIGITEECQRFCWIEKRDCKECWLNAISIREGRKYYNE